MDVVDAVEDPGLAPPHPRGRRFLVLYGLLVVASPPLAVDAVLEGNARRVIHFGFLMLIGAVGLLRTLALGRSRSPLAAAAWVRRYSLVLAGLMTVSSAAGAAAFVLEGRAGYGAGLGAIALVALGQAVSVWRRHE